MMTTNSPWRAFIPMLLCATGASLLLPLSDARATGFAPNVRPGSDIVMHDMRWPFFDEGTYYCFWYMRCFPADPRGGVSYGGLTTAGPESPAGMFMSQWGRIAGVYEGEYFYRHGYGAEGASGGTHGKALFVRPAAWYRFVMRVFPPTEGSDKETYVGWWVKDVEKNQWHTHSIVSRPLPFTGFEGNSGFVEALAPESVHRAFE